jgi:allantoinase
MDNLTLRSTRVVLPGGVRPAAIAIERGRITRIITDVVPDAIDFGDLVVSPGVVDTHVHINEPGRTEWEGFDTATRAAAAGGVTTVVDMPLNSVPATTDAASLETKREAARGKCHVDVAFWGGVVPGNASHLDALVDAGVRGFKCFLVPSGVDEFPPVGERDLRDAMPIIARRGVPLLVHAEHPRVIADCGLRIADLLRIEEVGSRSRIADSLKTGDLTASIDSQPSIAQSSIAQSSIAQSPIAQSPITQSTINPQSAILNPQYARYLATRPPEAEVEAIRLMIRLAREFGARVHIVHVASVEAADEIARAKADGISVTAETCPHYLTFAAEEIAAGATEFKCAPPIRDARHRSALLDALDRGTLDLVASDHSPAPPALKCGGDFLRAWGGIASVELSMAAVWTAAVARAFQASDCRSAESPALQDTDALRAISRWMSEAPAQLAGFNRKGRIAVGCDADFVVWDPDATRTVDPSRLQQRHKLTPYAGRTLRGVVHATFVRGQQVWRDDRLAHAQCGRLL